MAVDDSIVEAMRDMGAPPEQIAKAQALAAAAAPPQRPRPFGVWHDNTRAVNTFVALRTQWVYVAVPVGMGVTVPHRSGLKYEGVRAYLLTAEPRRRHRSLLQDLQTMELAVLQADAEIRKKQEKD